MLAESPLYQQWMAEMKCETRQEAIVTVLGARFGAIPEEVTAHVRSVTDLAKLERAIKHAARCTGFDDFRKRLARS